MRNHSNLNFRSPPVLYIVLAINILIFLQTRNKQKNTQLKQIDQQYTYKKNNVKKHNSQNKFSLSGIVSSPLNFAVRIVYNTIYKIPNLNNPVVSIGILIFDIFYTYNCLKPKYTQEIVSSVVENNVSFRVAIKNLVCSTIAKNDFVNKNITTIVLVSVVIIRLIPAFYFIYFNNLSKPTKNKIIIKHFFFLSSSGY